MSEMKVYHCNEWHNEYTEFYMKDEADKVIAELKNENERLKKEASCTFVDDCLRLRQTKRKLSHQKYKRCLAMAKWCHNQREIYERDSYNWELEDDAVNSLRNKANIMRKWRKHWIKIAEKFKHNLTAQ